MKFILPLLLVLLLPNYSLAQEASSSITVEGYFCFLTDPASLPEADQIYDSATMQNQIQQTKEEDQITYLVVDGQSDQPMSGLTDLEVELYSHWAEASDSTSTPLMMFDWGKKEDQRKTIALSEAQRQRQRDATIGSTASSSSYGRGSFMPITERTPLLPNGNSSASQVSTTSSSRAQIISAPQARIIAANNNRNDRVPGRFGTGAERQSLLGSTTRSSTTRPVERVGPATPSPQQRRIPFTAALLAQQSSTRLMTRMEDVHQIDDLINTTYVIISTKEKNNHISMALLHNASFFLSAWQLIFF